MSSQKLLITYISKYPCWVLLTIFLGFSGGLFNGVSTALIIPLVLGFLGQNVNLTNAPGIIQYLLLPFENIPQEHRITAMAVAVILVIILKNLASYASNLVGSSLQRALTADMREAGLKLLLEVDLDFHNCTSKGDLLNRLGGEIGRASSAIVTLIKLVIVVITILVFVAILLGISWQLTIVSTILLGIVALVNQYLISRSKHFGKVLSEMSRAYSIKVLEIINGIRLVKATANENREYQHIVKLIRAREKADFQAQANSGAILPISEVTGIIALMLIVVLGRMFFINQIESLSAVLLTYLLVLFRLLPFIAQLNTTRGQLANISTSVELAHDFLRRDNKQIMKNGSKPYQKLQEGIHFQKVSFGYPKQENLVLKDVDLYLPRGTTLALVGASGAGKSTLADLLLRFYDPTNGCITIDGIDLREFDIKNFRSRMGVVSQDTFLFNESIRNNITYGVNNVTESEIMAAAQQANAYEFITQMPNGFDTIIGDRGVLLSGGQRQRLAIARALLQNPDILILDEATSALDTASEKLIQTALEDLSRDRTTLIIAHRLSTVQKAHQIAVLDKGRVVEIGTHEQLLEKNGYYAQLYSMQFSNQSQFQSFLPKNESIIKASLKASQEIRTNFSYQIRSYLNPMLGSLKLMVDNMIDSEAEKQDLIEESYNSAINIINILELFEKKK